MNIRANQSLERYLQEIGEVPLLTPDEEIKLAKRIRKGDQIALEKLTKANLDLWFRWPSSTRIRGCRWAT